jgi:hypothetical protein
MESMNLSRFHFLKKSAIGGYCIKRIYRHSVLFNNFELLSQRRYLSHFDTCSLDKTHESLEQKQHDFSKASCQMPLSTLAMHLSSSHISNALCFSGNEGAFPSLPIGSFPIGSESKEDRISSVEDCQGGQIVSSGSSSEYREFRIPTLASVKRNAKISLARWRCRNSLKKASRGVTTFDDFTTDLYGFDVDDELPLLDDVYMHDQESILKE